MTSILETSQLKLHTSTELKSMLHLEPSNLSEQSLWNDLLGKMKVTVVGPPIEKRRREQQRGTRMKA